MISSQNNSKKFAPRIILGVVTTILALGVLVYGQVGIMIGKIDLAAVTEVMNEFGVSAILLVLIIGVSSFMVNLMIKNCDD
jgi:hypothetical protein